MRGTFAEMSNMMPGVMSCLAWGRGVGVERRGAFAQLGCVGGERGLLATFC